MRVIIINGLPGIGKSSLGETIVSRYGEAHFLRVFDFDKYYRLLYAPAKDALNCKELKELKGYIQNAKNFFDLHEK